MGPERELTSTKPSGSTRATLTCSPSTRFPISIFVVFPKRCESLIRFSISPRTTWIPSRPRRLLHKPRAICRVLRRSSLRSIRTPTTPTLWKHKFTKRSWSAALHQSSLGYKEILAKPDPALGYTNGELRFWLGWAQEVAGDHAAAQESWRQARSELEPFLKEQPENFNLLWRSRADQYGPRRQGRRVHIRRAGDGRRPDRERRAKYRQARAICRARLCFSLRFIRMPTTRAALETQVYQAILERLPTPVISRLKEILAKPDPALGFFNGELRFLLGWAQEVDGDHAAAQETWRQAQRELESFLKDQPDNYSPDWRSRADQYGPWRQSRRVRFRRESDGRTADRERRVSGPTPIEILARVAAQMGEPDRAIAALQKLLSIPYSGATGCRRRSLPRCSGSIQCSIRSGMIRASKNSAKTNRKHRISKCTR